MVPEIGATPWWVACWNQWTTERALHRRGVEFRSTTPNVVARGYDAMTADEFDAVNGRQEWANWQVLPTLLRSRLPERPLTVIDLGCGTGASTEALARCCPAGSRLLGIDRSPRLLQQAVRRHYQSSNGDAAIVDFRRQSIAEPWRSGGGMRLRDGAADLIASCGVLGHHFDRSTIGPVLSELRRVLHDDGFACLDAGPALSRSDLVAAMAAHGFREIASIRSCFLDRNRQIVFRSVS